jgi:hypothetical protein
MIFVISVTHMTCVTHVSHMCQTVTLQDKTKSPKMQKYDNRGIKLDIVTLTLYDTVTPM